MAALWGLSALEQSQATCVSWSLVIAAVFRIDKLMSSDRQAPKDSARRALVLQFG